MYKTSTYFFFQLFPAIFTLQTISLMNNSLLTLNFFDIHQNCYRFTSHPKFIWRFFRLSKSKSKSCFKLAIYWVAKLKPILEVKFERPMSFIPQIISIYKQTHMADNQSKICFKLTIYWVAKLKPILENKFERPMSSIPQS